MDLIGITVFCGEMGMKSYLTTQIKIAIMTSLVIPNSNWFCIIAKEGWLLRTALRYKMLFQDLQMI